MLINKLQKYVKETNWVTKILSILIPVLMLILWEYASTNGILNSSILPRPTKIWAACVAQIESGALQRHIVASVDHIAKGFLLGSALGLVFGCIFGLNKRVEEVFNLLLGMVRPIPPIACIPVFILLLGIGERSKVAVIALGSFWPVLVNTTEGIRGTDKDLLELAATIEKSKLRVLTEIVLPSAIPSIFTGLKLGISRAWSCVVVAEMIAASRGVGYLIEYARSLSKPDIMFVGVATIGIIGLAIDGCMDLLQRKLLYWHDIEK